MYSTTVSAYLQDRARWQPYYENLVAIGVSSSFISVNVAIMVSCIAVMSAGTRPGVSPDESLNTCIAPLITDER